MIIKDLPIEIQELVIKKQKEAGNIPNIDLYLYMDIKEGNFSWGSDDSIIWNEINEGIYTSFYESYSKSEERPVYYIKKSKFDYLYDGAHYICLVNKKYYSTSGGFVVPPSDLNVRKATSLDKKIFFLSKKNGKYTEPIFDKKAFGVGDIVECISGNSAITPGTVLVVTKTTSHNNYYFKGTPYCLHEKNIKLITKNNNNLNKNKNEISKQKKGQNTIGSKCSRIFGKRSEVTSGIRYIGSKTTNIRGRNKPRKSQIRGNKLQFN